MFETFPHLRRRATSAIAVILVLLTLDVIITAVLVAKQSRDQARVEHTLDVQLQLSRISALLQDAEAAQRGFLITAKPRFSGEFDQAAVAVPAAIDTLTKAVSDNPKQIETIGALRELSARRLDFLGQAMSLERSGKANEATTLIKTGRGKVLMDQGTDILEKMAIEERRVLADREYRSRETTLYLQGAVWTTILAAVSVGFFITLDVRSQFAALNAANTAMREARERETEESKARKTAEDQLRQSQKMEAVGHLTGGIAHDFNNMLGVVIGNLSLVQKMLASGRTEVTHLIESAMEGANRASTLTHRLLAFSRQQALAPSVTDTNILIGGIEDLLRRTIGGSVSLELIRGTGLWRTTIDRSQLEQAVVNLVLNARDAMPQGGCLTIETSNAVLDDAYVALQTGVKAGEYVVIAISDDGEGMTPDIAEKAFDPFFTTKPPGKGTGLGLSQVFGFVKQSGGHITIASTPGHGTTVKVYLSRSFDDLSSESRSGRESEALPVGHAHEVVLLVEDEERVRRMAVESLRELGYTVVDASTGREALRALEDNPRIDLLLTDVVMPGMNGRELADAVAERHPDIPVLYTSGYTRNGIIQDGKLGTQADLLIKPFTIHELAVKVRRLMDESPTNMSS